MEYRKLNRSDLLISRITLGCEQLGGTDWGVYNKRALNGTIKKALEEGINTFDTADVYGLGASEEFLANALKSVINKVVIISKFGVSWKKQKYKRRAEIFINGSPKYFEKALEASLKRLKIESIPIYFLHKPDPNTPINETLEAMQKQKKLGKIQNIGISNSPLNLIKNADSTGIINCVQISCNLLNYDKMKHIIEYCKEKKINIFIYGALAQGILTGKYNEYSLFSKNDRRHRLEHFIGTQLINNMKIVEKMKAKTKGLQVTLSQVALKYLLDMPEITSLIVGAKTPLQIKENVGAINIKLNSDFWKAFN
jgi:aryl-alcohol dehydrogenase-like predicted oxidoreductase